MNARLSVVCCALLLAACGKDAPHTPPSHAAAKPAVAARAGTSALTVKEFHLGMNINEVPDAMIDLLAEHGLSDYGFTQVMRYSNGEQCVLLYDKGFLGPIESRMHRRYTTQVAASKIQEALQSACYNSDGVVVVRAGPDGRVNRVAFNHVDEFFDARDMKPAQFAQKIAHDYHLPPLQPNADGSGWSDDTPDGTRLQVLVKQVFGIPVTRLVMGR